MKPKLIQGKRQPKESNNAVIACNDYLRMGPGRSLAKLDDRYQTATNPLPPTKRLATLKGWSKRFGWVERAAGFDGRWEEYKNAVRHEVFNTELALDYERVVSLNRLAQFLEEELYKQEADGSYSNIWLPDVKQIGGGEFAERVDIIRFNASLVQEFRETLDDLAAETGGRVKRSDVTSGGETLKAPVIYIPDNGRGGDD